MEENKLNQEFKNESNQLNELEWVKIAREFLGLKEFSGAKHNPIIQNWLRELGAWWSDDETAWCGVFVAICAKRAGRDIPKNWFRALEWANAGKVLNAPAYGCVVVFERVGGGHVGFCVGEDESGNLLILGGNQNNQVSISKFSKNRVKSYIWLSKNGVKMNPNESRYILPKMAHNGAFSANEV